MVEHNLLQLITPFQYPAIAPQGLVLEDQIKFETNHIAFDIIVKLDPTVQKERDIEELYRVAHAKSAALNSVLNYYNIPVILPPRGLDYEQVMSALYDVKMRGLQVLTKTIDPARFEKELRSVDYESADHISKFDYVNAELDQLIGPSVRFLVGSA